jgi:hypothetical protein
VSFCCRGQIDFVECILSEFDSQLYMVSSLNYAGEAGPLTKACRDGGKQRQGGV